MADHSSLIEPVFQSHLHVLADWVSLFHTSTHHPPPGQLNTEHQYITIFIYRKAGVLCSHTGQQF